MKLGLSSNDCAKLAKVQPELWAQLVTKQIKQTRWERTFNNVPQELATKVWQACPGDRH